VPLLRNPATGEVANYEGAAAMRALEIGYEPTEGGSLQVHTPSGATAQYAVEDVARANEGYGGRLSAVDAGQQEAAAREALEGRQFEAEYGGQGVRAFVEGGLSGISLGGYEAVADKLGMDTENVKKGNPWEFTGGEVGGMLGASILSGGAGAAGAIARATPAGFATAKGAALTAKLGATSLKGLAAGNAAEGAMYAGVQTFNKHLVQDEPFSASAMFADVALNSAIGAGGGAAGAVLAKSLGKAANRALGQGDGPVIANINTPEGKALVKDVGRSLAELDSVADDLVDALKPVKPGKLQPLVDPKLTKPLVGEKGRRASGGLERVVDEGDYDDFAIAPGAAAADPFDGLATGGVVDVKDIGAIKSATRESTLEDLTKGLRVHGKTLTSVGDQLFMEVAESGNKALIADARQLRKAYGDLTAARAQIDEIQAAHAAGGSVPAGNLADRAVTAYAAYERKVIELGKKLNFDVEAQLAVTRPQMSRAGRAAVPNAKAAAGAIDTLQAARQTTRQADDAARLAREGAEFGAGQGAREADAAAARALAGDEFAAAQAARSDSIKAGTRAMGDMNDATAKRAADSLALHADDVNTTRKLAKEALGNPRHLFSRPMSEIVPAVEALETHYLAIKRVAEATGNMQLVGRAEAAVKAIEDAVNTAMAVPGAGFDGASKALLLAGAGSYGADQAGVDTGPLGSLVEFAAMGRLAKGKVPGQGKSPATLGRNIASQVGRRTAPSVARALGILPKTAGLASTAGSAAASVVGGRLLGEFFDRVAVQRGVAGVTSGAKGRIAGAVDDLKLGKHATKAVTRSSLTGMVLLRQSTFAYDQERASKVTPDKDNASAFKRVSRELAAVAASPDAAQKIIHDELAPLRAIAPGVADELEMISLAAPLYLADKMPKDPGVVMRFGKSAWRPAEYEILQFGEHMRGALQPIEVYEDTLSGAAVSPKAIEAMKAVHPALFKEMQQEVMSRSDEYADKLDHSAGVRISLLVDAPVISTMRPEFRQFMKERHQLRAQAAAAPPSQTSTMGSKSSGSASASEPLTSVEQLLK
jgi:hypothetical protein